MNITVHQARDLALRIVGLFCVLWLFTCVPGAAYLATQISDSTYPGNATVEVFAQVALATFYLLAAYFLLFRTHVLLQIIWRTPEPESVSPSAQRLATVESWIRLMGVFFLVRSLPGVASEAAQWLLNTGYDSSSPTIYGAGGTIDNAITLALAIVCIRWPEAPLRLFQPALLRDAEFPGP